MTVAPGAPRPDRRRPLGPRPPAGGRFGLNSPDVDLLAFVAVVVVVVAVVVAVSGDPRGDDIHSVAELQPRPWARSSTCTGAGSAPSRTGAARSRVPRLRPGQPPGPGGRRHRTWSVPPVPVRGTDEFPDPDAPHRLRRRPARSSAGQALARRSRPAAPDRPGPAHALDSMNHRRRRGTAVHDRRRRRRACSWRWPSSAAKRSHTDVAAPHRVDDRPTSSATTPGIARATDHRRPCHGRRPPTRPTPTTLPTAVRGHLDRPPATSATYPLPHTTYQITADRRRARAGCRSTRSRRAPPSGPVCSRPARSRGPGHRVPRPCSWARRP